jgi:cytosine/adenosine deaminase-related metal-dependent hydrolase
VCCDIALIAGRLRRLASPEHADANVRALDDSGIRAVFLYGGPGPVGLGFFATPPPPHPDDARRVHDELFADGVAGRLRMGLALRGPAFTTPEATEADFALARELGVPISIHVGMAGFPGNVDVLDRLGLLGPDVNHAHANELSNRELDLISQSGGLISICPSIDMLMAVGTYPATGRALARDIRARSQRRYHDRYRVRSVHGDATGTGRRALTSQRRGSRPSRSGSDSRARPARHARSRHRGRGPDLAPRG